MAWGKIRMDAAFRWRFGLAFLPIVLACFLHPLARGQGGCASPPCAPNPTPCAQCTGTWTDDYGDQWTVNSPDWPSAPGTQQVSGSVVIPAQPEYDCPSYTFQVSGTLVQTPGSSTTAAVTSFSWNAANPSPNTPCGLGGVPTGFTFSGNIGNNTCDAAGGTWANSDGSASGSFTMSKPPDAASTEITVAIAWWSIGPTVLQFQGEIASSLDLAGRQVFESANGSSSDSCWRSGDVVEGYALQPFHITGGGWFVGYYYFNDWWDYDYVGYSPDVVTYFRDKMRTPCQASAPQAMNVYTSNGSVTYYTDTLQISLPDDTNVGVERGGVWGWRSW
jgi:hypothetical protein